MKSFITAMSMFTVIPMPRSEWDERGGSSALALFGIVGLIIGAICAAVYEFLRFFSVDIRLMAVIMAFLPHVVSGFLHLDGFMDVSDAVLSHRDREGRLKILKDPHAGSFAIIMLVILSAVLIFATLGTVDMNVYPMFFALVPMLSRSAAGLTLLNLKPLEGSSLGAYFTKNKKTVHSVVLAATLVIPMMIMVFLGYVPSIILAAIGYAIATACTYRSLGGINGDVTGFLVCIVEAMLVAGVLL